MFSLAAHDKRYVGYLATVISCALAVFLLVTTSLFMKSVLPCDSSHYGKDAFLAYCNEKTYSYYEHGAIFHDMEGTSGRIREADVLFLGSSRAMFAFSTNAVRSYFSAMKIPYFILGFSYDEQDAFPLLLMEKFQARPKVLVINTDPFFADKMSWPATEAVEGGLGLRLRYLAKQAFQKVHGGICALVPTLCQPRQPTLFGSRFDGAWIADGALGSDKKGAYPIGEKKKTQMSREDLRRAGAFDIARRFIAKVGLPPACIVLVGVPTHKNNSEQMAAYISREVGASMIAAGSDMQLYTFDFDHLNKESAERYSEEFMRYFNYIWKDCAGSR